MRIIELCKIELYRFFHSLTIIKYVVILTLALLYMSYFNILFLDTNVTGDLMWDSLVPDFLYLLAIVCVIIALYIGREFQRKTINHEVMSGYGFGAISVAKTLTCGLLISIMLVLCIALYMGTFVTVLSGEHLLRFFFLFILFFHICSGTVLYVMLCKNSVLGGCLAFGKFFVIENVLIMFSQAIMPVSVKAIISNLAVCNQWYTIVDIRNALTFESMVFMVATAVIEYGLLQIILYAQSMKMDM